MVASELTRFGNPKPKPKLILQQRITRIKERRRISDAKNDAKRVAKKKRQNNAARNRQAQRDRANKRKVDQQTRRDEEHAADGAEAPD